MAKSPLAVVPIIALFIGGLLGPRSAEAQAIKLHKKTTSQGEIVRTPYISYTEFQDATVSGKAAPGTVSGEEVTFRDLITISSLDKVPRRLGEPDNFTRAAPFGDVRAYFLYDGLRLEYIKYESDSHFRLREMKLTSPDWSLTVNGTRLQPGMPSGQLSPALRQTLNYEFSEAEDAVGSVIIAKPGTATQVKQGGELKAIDGNGAITVFIDKGTVKEVRFHREL